MYSAKKMVIYATIIPFGIGENIQLTLSQEIIKTLINMTEIILLFQSLKSKNNFTDEQESYKIITIDGVWLSHSLVIYFII